MNNKQELRKKFFDECTVKDSVDGTKIRIDYAPHDLFEWFWRASLPAQPSTPETKDKPATGSGGTPESILEKWFPQLGWTNTVRNRALAAMEECAAAKQPSPGGGAEVEENHWETFGTGLNDNLPDRAVTDKMLEAEFYVDEYIKQKGVPPTYEIVAEHLKISKTAAYARLRRYRDRMITKLATLRQPTGTGNWTDDDIVWAWENAFGDNGHKSGQEYLQHLKATKQPIQLPEREGVKTILSRLPKKTHNGEPFGLMFMVDGSGGGWTAQYYTHYSKSKDSRIPQIKGETIEDCIIKMFQFFLEKMPEALTKPSSPNPPGTDNNLK